jgi:hypothetical protein
MHSRRNEHESYQALISLLPHYVNLQLMVQNGISIRCKQFLIEYNLQLPECFTNFYFINNDNNNINVMAPII